MSSVKFDQCGENKHDAISRKLSNAQEKVRGMLKAKFTKCQGSRLTFQLASPVGSDRFYTPAKINFSLARRRHFLI